MADNAEAVLALDDLKRELRIPLQDHEHDELILAQRDAAVSFVSVYLRAPLVDSDDVLRPLRPGDATAPLVVYAPHVQSMAPVRFWTAASSLRLDPDGEIALADLGRTVQAGARFVLWPPSAGWPDVLEGSHLEIELRRGIDPTPRSLAQAVILAAREFHNGYHSITGTAAMYALIHPWRQLAAPPRGPLSG